MIDYKEQTTLSPIATQVRIEAWITDAKYLDNPNRFNEWIFDFQPLTTHDIELIHEVGNRCLFDVEMESGPYSNKKPEKGYERNNGSLFATQLFKPQLNIDSPDPYFWHGREVSLCLHFRDLPSGLIVINADYVDTYEDDYKSQEVLVNVRPERVDYGDW